MKIISLEFSTSGNWKIVCWKLIIFRSIHIYSLLLTCWWFSLGNGLCLELFLNFKLCPWLLERRLSRSNLIRRQTIRDLSHVENLEIKLIWLCSNRFCKSSLSENKPAKWFNSLSWIFELATSILIADSLQHFWAAASYKIQNCKIISDQAIAYAL